MECFMTDAAKIRRVGTRQDAAFITGERAGSVVKAFLDHQVEETGKFDGGARTRCESFRSCAILNLKTIKKNTLNTSTRQL